MFVPRRLVGQIGPAYLCLITSEWTSHCFPWTPRPLNHTWKSTLESMWHSFKLESVETDSIIYIVLFLEQKGNGKEIKRPRWLGFVGQSFKNCCGCGGSLFMDWPSNLTRLAPGRYDLDFINNLPFTSPVALFEDGLPREEDHSAWDNCLLFYEASRKWNCAAYEGDAQRRSCLTGLKATLR